MDIPSDMLIMLAYHVAEVKPVVGCCKAQCCHCQHCTMETSGNGEGEGYKQAVPLSELRATVAEVMKELLVEMKKGDGDSVKEKDNPSSRLAPSCLISYC